MPKYDAGKIIGSQQKVIVTHKFETAQKLMRAKNLGLVFDFDGTLSRGMNKKELSDIILQIESKTGKTLDKEDILANHPTNESAQKIYSGWAVIEWLLSREARQKCRQTYEMYEKYLTKNGKKAASSNLQLCITSSREYVKEGLRREQIYFALESIPLRNGWNTLKNYLSKLRDDKTHKICIAAVTYGFRYVFDRVDFAGVFDDIYGCTLNFRGVNQNQVVSGVSLDVTPATKKDKVKEFRTCCDADTKIIAIGDSLQDRFMFQAADLSVFLAHKLVNQKPEDIASFDLKQVYDISDVIITSDELYPVKNLIEFVSG